MDKHSLPQQATVEFLEAASGLELVAKVFDKTAAYMHSELKEEGRQATLASAFEAVLEEEYQRGSGDLAVHRTHIAVNVLIEAAKWFTFYGTAFEAAENMEGATGYKLVLSFQHDAQEARS
jgi:hypothetical protein